jgi:hypothetical protein
VSSVWQRGESPDGARCQECCEFVVFGSGVNPLTVLAAKSVVVCSVWQRGESPDGARCQDCVECLVLAARCSLAEFKHVRCLDCISGRRELCGSPRRRQQDDGLDLYPRCARTSFIFLMFKSPPWFCVLLMICHGELRHSCKMKTYQIIKEENKCIPIVSIIFLFIQSNFTVIPRTIFRSPCDRSICYLTLIYTRNIVRRGRCRVLLAMIGEQVPAKQLEFQAFLVNTDDSPARTSQDSIQYSKN